MKNSLSLIRKLIPLALPLCADGNSCRAVGVSRRHDERGRARERASEWQMSFLGQELASPAAVGGRCFSESTGLARLV